MARYSDGTIIEIEKGRKYKVRVSLGYDPLKGRYDRVTRTVNGTLADAKRKRDELVEEHRAGLRVNEDKVTFYEYSTRWLSERETLGAVAKSTLDKDRCNLQTLNGYLAAARLRDVTPDVVRRLLPLIKADKVRERGSFSNTTLAMIFRLLKQIMQDAVKEKLIPDNPCDGMRAPVSDSPKRRALKREEAARLAAFLDAEEERMLEAYAEKERRAAKRGELFTRKEIYGLNDLGRLQAVRIALSTGMRRGEVFGLTWERVDLRGGVIKVRESLTVDGSTKPPKSRKGIRDIHIDSKTLAHLKAWKAYQSRELGKLGVSQGEATPVCCSDIGGYSDLRNFGRFWDDLRTCAGFPGLRFHELRHTQASLLIGDGVDVKTVQTRLGHYSAALTLDWYSHADPEQDKRAGDRFGELLRQDEGAVLAIKTA